MNESIRLLSVSSQKIHYLPGEEARFFGEIENRQDRECEVSVRCQLIRRVHDLIDLGSRQVAIPAKSKTEIEFTFPLDGVEFGYEVQMWLEGDPRIGREFFGVSRNVIEIGIFGDSDYANYADIFAWAPDDFGDLAPEGESWWAGQGGNEFTRADFEARITRYKERGIKVLTYGKGIAGGRPGMELLYEHPDWASYNRWGQLGGMNMGFDVWPLKHWDHHYDDEGKKWYFVWPCWTPDFHDPEVVRYGAQALVEGAAMWGFDGVRFDAQFDMFGGFSCDGTPTDRGESREELNIRNMERTKEHILQANPDFIFGYNYGAAHSPPTPADRVFCSGGALIMDEEITLASDPQHPDNSWPAFARRILSEVESTGQAGGHQIIFNHNRLQRPIIADHDYGLIFCFAGGGRPYAWPYKSMRYRYDQYATRYSEYLMNDAIRRLDDPDEIFAVRSEGEVWWRDWAAQYRATDGTRAYILHLINAPPTDGITETPFPERQRGIEIEVRLPEGQTLIDAWLIAPEPEVNQQRLAPTARGPAFDLKVDELDLWKTVLVRTADPG